MLDKASAIAVRKAVAAEHDGKLFARGMIEVKSVTEDADFYHVEGIATTPTPDFANDIVEPLGADYKIPIPFLWQHNALQPIGNVTYARPTKDGIPYKAQIPKIKEPGTLKDRLDDAVQSMKYKLVRASSIGFTPDWSKVVQLKNGGLQYMKWKWHELSAVTIGMNEEATAAIVKSFDQRQRAALGHADPIPGASGKSPGATPSQTRSVRKDMKSIQEQVAELNERRSNAVARVKEIGDLWETDGHTKSQEERDELRGLNTEISDIDDDLMIKSVHLVNVAKAKPVHTTEGARRSAGGYVFVKGADKDEAFKGQNFTRKIIAKALAHLDEDHRSPATMAEERWGKTNPTLVAIMKANEVPGAGSASGEWGSELVNADTRYTGDFIEYLYAQTAFDKLPLRRVPANVMIKGQDGASTAYWVGESKAIPATTADFMNVSLTPLKVAALAVVPNEWIRDSSPEGEMLVRDSLVNASAQRIDTTFLSTSAASAGVSPAGILNGVSAIVSTGSDAMALRADLLDLYAPFITAKNASGLWLVMGPSLAKSISLMVNALGQVEFNGVNSTGGTLLGDNIVVSDNVPSGYIILIKPSDVYRIGDLGVQVSISKDAMIEQSTAPTGATDTPVAASQYFTSMFQEESTAIKVVRPINFAKRRASAVQYATGAAYGGAGS